MMSKLQQEAALDIKSFKDIPTIFIDRDGERFQYCLDYMKEGGPINIPETVCKNALLQDFEYYGFRLVKPTDIVVVANKSKLLEDLEDIEAELESRLVDVKKRKRELEERY